ncbi:MULTISPECIES: hypothetical protein [Winogradskyella]|uniref:hypothetical protein n=1 Tax=Winogradskyella TaxID=286104 RepID=UPI0015C6A2F8|nr:MULTISPECIES: hypothetical protein [Winogradskyella]QNK77958.1 hypothetical protein H7F37_02395 [Winogradskyella sp. PAMC22761]QXP79034.1 hypothetical protein H0I32_17845 [Winogradskyella sp. HaHa_3_26]
MKKMTKILFLITVIGITSCSPKISSNFINPQPKLSIDEKVALLDIEHNLPKNNIIKVGELRFQDSGFSTDCSFNSLMTQARNEARKNGANIVKVVDKKKPDLWSTCYRLKIDLYKYDKDVSSLPQYQLKLD